MTHGKPLTELAAVVWEDKLTPRVAVRDLLQSVDAFVLPTRGEVGTCIHALTIQPL